MEEDDRLSYREMKRVNLMDGTREREPRVGSRGRVSRVISSFCQKFSKKIHESNFSPFSGSVDGLPFITRGGRWSRNEVGDGRG